MSSGDTSKISSPRPMGASFALHGFHENKKRTSPYILYACRAWAAMEQVRRVWGGNGVDDEDREFLSEVSATLKRLIKEAKRRRFSTLGYLLEMALIEAQGQLRK